MRKLLLLAVAVVLACTTVTPVPTPEALVVEPASAHLMSGAQLVFKALLGAAPATVTWSVSGAGCGTIDQTGLYTAPACPSPAPAAGSVITTCTVTATVTSIAPATALATTTDTIASVTVAPPTASVPVTKTQKFTATITGGCGGTYTTP